METKIPRWLQICAFLSMTLWVVPTAIVLGLLCLAGADVE